LDGQLGRVIEVEEQYSNLIRIPVPIFEFSLQLVSTVQDCEINDIEKMVITEGYQAIESYLSTHPYNQQLFKVKNITTQLNLLAQSKVDGALVLNFHIPQEFKIKYKNTWYFKDLNTIPVYHYVHRKHENLADSIEKELLKLTANGTIAELKLKYNI
jgi:ABC-type amino acid transport substrate-binding protein